MNVECYMFVGCLEITNVFIFMLSLEKTEKKRQRMIESEKEVLGGIIEKKDLNPWTEDEKEEVEAEIVLSLSLKFQLIIFHWHWYAQFHLPF